MKTNIDVNAKNGTFTVTVTRADGALMHLDADTVEEAARIAHFLIEAFSQEHIAAIDRAHTITMESLDAVAFGDGGFAKGKSH